MSWQRLGTTSEKVGRSAAAEGPVRAWPGARSASCRRGARGRIANRGTGSGLSRLAGRRRRTRFGARLRRTPSTSRPLASSVWAIVGAASVAVEAVAPKPARRPGDEREVVRQARVRDGVVVREQRVPPREPVEDPAQPDSPRLPTPACSRGRRPSRVRTAAARWRAARPDESARVLRRRRRSRTRARLRRRGQRRRRGGCAISHASRPRPVAGSAAKCRSSSSFVNRDWRLISRRRFCSSSSRPAPTSRSAWRSATSVRIACSSSSTLAIVGGRRARRRAVRVGRNAPPRRRRGGGMHPAREPDRRRARSRHCCSRPGLRS